MRKLFLWAGIISLVLSLGVFIQGGDGSLLKGFLILILGVVLISSNFLLNVFYQRNAELDTELALHRQPFFLAKIVDDLLEVYNKDNVVVAIILVLFLGTGSTITWAILDIPDKLVEGKKEDTAQKVQENIGKITDSKDLASVLKVQAETDFEKARKVTPCPLIGTCGGGAESEALVKKAEVKSQEEVIKPVFSGEKKDYTIEPNMCQPLNNGNVILVSGGEKIGLTNGTEQSKIICNRTSSSVTVTLASL
jgi:hypothetical protein